MKFADATASAFDAGGGVVKNVVYHAVDATEFNSEVTAVEIDPELCGKLRKRFENENKFTLLEMDVMELSPEALAGLIPAPAKVVANLPYNIATPLILRMLPVRNAWQSLTLMVQLEVAERICATPASGKVYGPLSLVGALGFESAIIKP